MIVGSKLALIWPVMMHMLLVFVVGAAAGLVRSRSAKAGDVRMKDIALSSDAWPELPRKLGNNFTNQFETPLVFYMLTGLALYLGVTGLAMAVCAWGYVASRYIHAAIHITNNNVPRRFMTFVLGVGFLAAMWVQVMITLLQPVLGIGGI